VDVGYLNRRDQTLSRRQAASWRRWSSKWITASLLALVSVWLVGCLAQSPPAGNTPRAVPIDNTPTPLPTPIPPRALAGTPHPQPAQPIKPGNASRVTQLARWGKGTARTTAFSPDGQTLAVASSLGIYLHDAATLTEVRFIPTIAPVAHIAFSPNGRTIAFALFSDIVWLNDVIWLGTPKPTNPWAA
jgi:WD40 repeat protein